MKLAEGKKGKDNKILEFDLAWNARLPLDYITLQATGQSSYILQNLHLTKACHKRN